MSIIKNINEDQVVIYSLDMDAQANKLHKLLRYLSDYEKGNVYMYSSELLMNRYIITRGFLRLILHYYTKQDPENIQIKFGIYGKPFVPNNEIKFNISHSNNIVCYAVTINKEIGVDIEFQNKNLSFENLLSYILSKDEIITFHALNDNEKLNIFYKLWTKKEAIVKAIGSGLMYNITNINTLPFEEKSKVSLFYEPENKIKELYCYPIKVMQNYSGFIATDKEAHKVEYVNI